MFSEAAGEFQIIQIIQYKIINQYLLIIEITTACKNLNVK